jgi:hypothetical protein
MLKSQGAVDTNRSNAAVAVSGFRVPGAQNPGTFGTAGTDAFIGLSLVVSRAIVVSDDFDRADEVLSVSANWDTPTGVSDWNIVSNTVRDTTGGAVDNAARWTAPLGNDHFAQADCTLGTAYSGVEIVARAADTSTFASGYAFFWNTDTGGTYGIWNYATATMVGVTVTGVGTTGTRNLRFEAIGSSLIGYVDGVEVINRTDSSQTGRYVGLVGGFDGTTPIIDNFRAGSL